jgi:rubredoxin
MNFWLCSECNYVLKADTPPEVCPNCNQKCVFTDVTCYIPECGGPDNFDSKLVALKAKAAEEKDKRPK